MRDDSLVVWLLSVKSCKAIRFHLLVVVMVLLSRFLIIVEAPMAEWSNWTSQNGCLLACCREEEPDGTYIGKPATCWYINYSSPRNLKAHTKPEKRTLSIWSSEDSALLPWYKTLTMLGKNRELDVGILKLTVPVVLGASAPSYESMGPGFDSRLVLWVFSPKAEPPQRSPGFAGQTPGVMIASYKLESYSPPFRRLLTVSRSLGDYCN
uniref:Uncharacterized protein n=1 Tax=Timema douglasi TaxID=61478 RepID=A0A7R8VC83_TIMDO|nr:unnamed protein product [Timema douglasi]